MNVNDNPSKTVGLEKFLLIPQFRVLALCASSSLEFH